MADNFVFVKTTKSQAKENQPKTKQRGISKSVTMTSQTSFQECSHHSNFWIGVKPHHAKQHSKNYSLTTYSTPLNLIHTDFLIRLIDIMNCRRKTPKENDDKPVENIHGVIYDEQLLNFVKLLLLLTLLHLERTMSRQIFNKYWRRS